MKFSLIINQKFAVKHGLTLHEATLFAFLYDAYGKPWMDMYDDGYCWLAKSIIVKQLPILNLKPDTIGRHCAKLDKLGLIKRRLRDGKKSTYKLTKKAMEWGHSSTDDDPRSEAGPRSDFNDNRGRISTTIDLGFQRQTSTDGDPTNKTIDYKTIDDKTIEKKESDFLDGQMANSSQWEAEKKFAAFELYSDIYRDNSTGSVTPDDAVIFISHVIEQNAVAEFALGMQNYLNGKSTQRNASYKNFSNYITTLSWKSHKSPKPGLIHVPGAPKPPTENEAFGKRVAEIADPFGSLDSETETVIEGELANG